MTMCHLYAIGARLRARYILQCGLVFLITTNVMAAQLSFAGQTVTVSGATPGGKVAVFAVELVPQGYESRIVHTSKVLTADATGTLSCSADSIERSVWAVVDLTSGALAAGAPKGSRAEVTDLLTAKQPIAVGATTLARGSRYLFVFLARPSSGAIWTLAVGDGGPGDSDGKGNAIVMVPFRNLKASGSTQAAPDHLAPGDVLVAIDPYTLHAYTAALPQR